MMENYTRTPIILNSRTVAVIHLFRRTDKIDDLWMYDSVDHLNKQYNQHEEAAKQFLLQLEGEECRLFIEKLRNECENWLKEDNKYFDK